MRTTGYARMLLAIGCAGLWACGGGGGSSTGGAPNEPPPEPPAECDAGTAYEGTFEAIQDAIFEKKGCTQDVCHGSSAQGGLDLRPEVAYDNLFEKPSVGSSKPLVTPGDRTRSYLWLKLAAATEPGSVEINGAPMPNGLPPLSAGELEAVRLWIYAGAPETGTVGGTEGLLDACLPEPKPITIEPLDPPAENEGFQLVLPQWPLRAGTEREICFATYYDVTDQVPDEFMDPSGGWFRFKGFDLRQDPQSHHLILYYPTENFRPEGIDVNAPDFGQWTCAGGDEAGAACDPKDLGSCGSGQCISEIQDPSFACIGFGPGNGPSIPVGGAQQAQAHQVFYDGVFAQLPAKGVIYWNSHAFNLTGEDTMMNGRINYLYATDQRFTVNSIFDAHLIFAPKAPPFTTERVCGDHVLPQGARLFELTSHTHKHGKEFTIDLPDGTRVYESFIYNDPVRQRYDPPLAFDSADPKERTLRYCGLFNNGVKEDGSPDVELVTRYSRLPEPIRNGEQLGICKPVACVNEGKIGAPCNGVGDDAACDTSPGAGDGWCDACRITGGESTENEMFNLFGAAYVDPSAVSRAEGLESAAGGLYDVDENGRSLYSGPALPHVSGCATSHMNHAAAVADSQSDHSHHGG
ncbi:MAG: hypothetical protein FJ144_06445 [Deltaproteobacteria bacterium]|nr:hypothetical protein [Deltaproteobacteria bacterium]